MICCVNCFRDSEIKSIIHSLRVTGNCDICGSKNISVYDTCDGKVLSDLFDGLLDIYKTKDNLPDDFPKMKLNLLKDELYSNWNIFNIDKDQIYVLIREICHEKLTENPEIFDDPVGIPEYVQESYLYEKSILKNYEWQEFVQAIKNQNRFHTHYINEEVLSLFCDYMRFTYQKGEMFYRARISSQQGFTLEQMGAPPSEKASAGRANSMGISCLYLSNNQLTTIKEIRAGVVDTVTIGKFESLRDIEVVNLESIDKISPFLDIDFTQHAINIKHLRKIGTEISKPLRISDGPLDYLPTQYICDYIKSKGFHGVRYKSTMGNEGYNIAIFDESYFECKSVEVLKIDGLNYSYHPTIL